MAAIDKESRVTASAGYAVKDRSAKLAKRRGAWPDDNRRSIATIRAIKVRKGREAAARMAARRGSVTDPAPTAKTQDEGGPHG